MDTMIEVEVIAPWFVPEGFKPPRIIRRPNGVFCVQGYVEGGEDGSPALRLPAKAEPRHFVYAFKSGGFFFIQHVKIEEDGMTIRLWRPKLAPNL
jgi:hypothetical protein